jgi:oxygen-independent coproporphyrinogen-3 oxidase
MNLRQNYLPDRNVDTVYFGGGTPTLLPASDLAVILESVNNSFVLTPSAEITLEANPDDLNSEVLHQYKRLGFNRISIGIQSFNDQHLTLMNRRHDARQAEVAVRMAADAGFERISIDLIYGIPGMSMDQWEDTIRKATKLPANHLSAYHLTFESGTRFSEWKNEGTLIGIPEDDSFRQYLLLIRLLDEAGYLQYEISNFARNGEISRHNSKYWSGDEYLGLGPSAHSFNGGERHWNPRSISGWKDMVNKGKEPDGEVLDDNMRVNEHLMTRLRTSAGIDLEEYAQRFGEAERMRLLKLSDIVIRRGDMLIRNGKLVFDRSAWFRSDGMMSDLFRGTD